MYMTRMELDTQKRPAMKALVELSKLHGAVEHAFPGPRTRKLWRIDNLAGKYYLLLVSEKKPALEGAAKQFGLGDGAWLTKEYDKLLNRIAEGSVWHFRLTANPTQCVKNAGSDRGVIHAHITPYYQKQWLLERAENAGFSLQEEDFSVVKKHWERFYKGEARKKPVNFLAVTFEGILRVTDAEQFKKTLVEGLGREKAYGMGMLTVVKAEV